MLHKVNDNVHAIKSFISETLITDWIWSHDKMMIQIFSQLRKGNFAKKLSRKNIQRLIFVKNYSTELENICTKRINIYKMRNLVPQDNKKLIEI